MRRLCDKLYQSTGKLLMPVSIISGKPVEVIHHFFTKQSSSRLRYDMTNGIPLTHGEHFAHHIKSDPTIHATVIKVRGQKWYNELYGLRKEMIKVNREYYERIYQELLKIYENALKL